MLTVHNVFKLYPIKTGFFSREQGAVYALSDISLHVNTGEIYGIVGETGCGKTTLARTIASLIPPSAGHIIFQDNAEKHTLLQAENKTKFSGYRRRVRYIFQDPAHSLNSRMTIRNILWYSYRFSSGDTRKEIAFQRIQEVLEEVELSTSILDRRPPDFSGGQRQRISIARALITKPSLIICDEVVSALDAPIRKRILDLLLRLREKYQSSLLFISHDIATMSYICDRVGVLFRGMLVEEGPVKDMIKTPIHPYTQRLYRSVPRMGEWHYTPISHNRSYNPMEPPVDLDVWQASYNAAQSRVPHADMALSRISMQEIAPQHYVSIHQKER